jgi:ATP-dependent protease ClpP protease subunit
VVPELEPEPFYQAVDIVVTIDETGCSFVEPDPDEKLLHPDYNGQPKLSQLSWIMGDRGYIKIFSGLTVADVTRTWNDLTIFEWLGFEDVTVFLNSPGGDAFSGLALANFILKFRDRGLIINIEASGIVASAAVPILAAGSHREALPGTIFMVHEAALWKWPGRETASDIRSQNELMTILRNEYLGILADHTKTPFKKWEEMEGRTTWFNVERAKELGLID